MVGNTETVVLRNENIGYICYEVRDFYENNKQIYTTLNNTNNKLNASNKSTLNLHSYASFKLSIYLRMFKMVL